MLNKEFLIVRIPSKIKAKLKDIASEQSCTLTKYVTEIIKKDLKQRGISINVDLINEQ